MKFIDLTGNRYNKLTVIKFSHSNGGAYFWLCRCDCGKEKLIRSSAFKLGTTVSCGCYGKTARVSHGLSGTRLSTIYYRMVQRCSDKNLPDFRYWGGKGITVCHEWLNEKTRFFDWALSHGYENHLQLDRINNDLGYTPDNCRFVTRKVNCRNRSSNIILTYNNESKTLVEWCEILSLPYHTIKDRIRRYKWDAIKAFTTPVLKYQRN